MRKRKLNKLKIGILVILALFVFSISVFGRYIYNGVRETYLTARQFYFRSNILTVNGSEYQYNNWGGTGVYTIEFELYSYLNLASKLDYDLDYTVTCSTSDSDKIRLGINSGDIGAPTTVDGTIYATTNASKIGIFVTAIDENIAIGESVKIQVTASTTVPYEKTISCEFTLIRENATGLSYLIEDAENNEYAILQISNARESSVLVTLEFDPTELRIDMNDEIYINKTSQETITIDGKQYVKKIVFNLDAETAKNVKFYKVEMTQDYTYPNVPGISAISVTT